MKALVLGAGLQGRACLWDLARQRSFRALGIADRDAHRLRGVAEAPWAHGIATHAVEAADREGLRRLFETYDLVVSALPYVFNLELTRLAIATGTHFLDMGGNTGIVRAQQALDRDAREAGITVLPDGGLAPGLTSVLAGHLIRTLSPQEVRLRVGGLPLHPRPPWNYHLFFSPYGLLNEYAGEALALRGGRVVALPVLEEEERLEFPEVGPLEAALTSGGTSTLPYTFEGQVSELDYKTIRFPGHFQRIRVLRDLGLLEDRTLEVPRLDGPGRLEVSLRDVMATLLLERLDERPVPDQVLLRVAARCGEAIRGFQARILGDSASGWSAMQRATALPVAIEAGFIAEGALSRRGVLRQETDVKAPRLLEELKARGLAIRELD
jgi:lysine 6-dehydrogenase